MTSSRADLLTGLRILEANGLIDFNGHASIRTEGGLVINSGKSVRSRLSADDLVTADQAGTVAPGCDAAPMEVHIHTEIYRRRPDVGAVVHGHPFWSTLLSSSGLDFAVVFAQASLLGDVMLYPSPLSINTPTLGGEVADRLGDRRAVLLRAHGIIVAAADIRTATVLALYLEDNARRQCLAAQMGGSSYCFSADEIAVSRKNLDRPNLYAKAWDYFEAKLASPPARSEPEMH
ncbi:L-fuculose phosphate aldolase [Hartmannibacter diazotrophicus]|uniref:L-fuculose phosphate aldolase n=1 Tax=Hartmannibacter diazotrophicus TaxID=1482074 RepID=A0A2C9DBZ5_9HYPH|nr:class II aldolase/adducin family protein [Hartmannibacter diazotrophicus]SON57786.1 L-fuculose phosphate aldolase [Hartmannibacter diazotrophicus]